MSYRGTGVFRRYVPDPAPKRRLAQELACVLDTAEPYRAPDAPRRGMYDDVPDVDYSTAKLSCWTNNRKHQGRGIYIVHY